MDVYSDDEIGRRKSSTRKKQKEKKEKKEKKGEKEEESARAQKNPTTPTTTSTTTKEEKNDDDVKNEVGGKGKQRTPLTRNKAALVKTESVPSIGSAFMETKKTDEDDQTDTTEPTEPTDDSELPEEDADDGKKEEREKEKEPDDGDKKSAKEEEKRDSLLDTLQGHNLVAEKIYNNYFSVGVDAKVQLDFHIARESNPENFKSRNYNKFKYFQYGAFSVLGGIKDLNKKLSVFVDGKEAKIPKSVEGVVALNLPSYASGTNPWKNNKPTQEWAEQRIDDGLLEVVGVNGTLHLGQIRTGLSTGVQLGQGKEVVFILKENLPMQADGEPWLQVPATIVVTLHNKTKMLRRVAPPSVLAMLSPTQWFKKGKKQDASAAKERNEFGADEATDEAGPIVPPSPTKAGAAKPPRRKRTSSKKGKDKGAVDKKDQEKASS